MGLGFQGFRRRSWQRATGALVMPSVVDVPRQSRRRSWRVATCCLPQHGGCSATSAFRHRSIQHHISQCHTGAPHLLLLCACQRRRPWRPASNLHRRSACYHRRSWRRASILYRRCLGRLLHKPPPIRAGRCNGNPSRCNGNPRQGNGNPSRCTASPSAPFARAQVHDACGTLTAHRPPLTAHRSPLTAHRSSTPLTPHRHPHRSPSHSPER